MHEIGAFEAKNKLGSLLDLVERVEEVTITRHGRPVARLVSAKPGFRPEGGARRCRADSRHAQGHHPRGPEDQGSDRRGSDVSLVLDASLHALAIFREVPIPASSSHASLGPASFA